MVAPTSSVSLEPIDRLAEKVRSLIGILERTRAELTRTTEDNARLAQDIEDLRSRLAAAEEQGSRAVEMQAEREQIHTRVSELLEQLEELSL